MGTQLGLGTLYIENPETGEKQELSVMPGAMMEIKTDHLIEGFNVVRRAGETFTGTLQLHLTPFAVWRLYGIKITNNYIKMHGGVLYRRVAIRKAKKGVKSWA